MIKNGTNLWNQRNQGRFGDTQLRSVKGQLSHVNPQETKVIDTYGNLGEDIVAKAGSGSVNPYTGLREYWSLEDAFQGIGDFFTNIYESNKPDWGKVFGTDEDPYDDKTIEDVKAQGVREKGALKDLFSETGSYWKSTEDKLDKISDQGIKGLESTAGGFLASRQKSGGMASTSAYGGDFMSNMVKKFELITGKEYEKTLRDYVSGGKSLLEDKRSGWDNYLANMASGLRTYKSLGTAGSSVDRTYDQYGKRFDDYRGGSYS